MKVIGSFLLLLVISVCPSVSGAQEYYYVSDPDGYSNLRNGSSSQATIVMQVNTGHCVVGLFNDNGWIKVIVYFEKDRVQVAGFIHGTRLKPNSQCKDDLGVRSIPVGDFALEGLDFNKGFKEASAWFRKNTKYIIDDGYYAEGYSEYVMSTLAKSFDQNVEFLSSAKTSSPDFVKFIMRHINATGDSSDLDAIMARAKKCVEKSQSEICKEIALHVKEAIEEM